MYSYKRGTTYALRQRHEKLTRTFEESSNAEHDWRTIAWQDLFFLSQGLFTLLGTARATENVFLTINHGLDAR